MQGRKKFQDSCSVDEPHIYGIGYVCCEECAQKSLRIKAEAEAAEKAAAEKARMEEEKEKAKRKTEREKRKAEREKAKAEKEKAKKEGKRISKPVKKQSVEDLDPEWIMKNGLCGICRTSYKDCSLMQTEFRIKPEGAKYVDSKIVECPLFR